MFYPPYFCCLMNKICFLFLLSCDESAGISKLDVFYTWARLLSPTFSLAEPVRCRYDFFANCNDTHLSRAREMFAEKHEKIRKSWEVRRRTCFFLLSASAPLVFLFLLLSTSSNFPCLHYIIKLSLFALHHQTFLVCTTSSNVPSFIVVQVESSFPSDAVIQAVSE